eukprot:CAMPEP_0115110236 /NCGR_PEP_ID=MMETSP0227-20121206/39255_1 /TAXON_ID=89957 /ORGANISM="Polarella glacialis, Strain CCMP 1383" /LENGTH=296 /DNA_ID=CAMNT_0002509235 /DNA_START=47 /DNA_END=937 /DNA_ORIENTATION=-
MAELELEPQETAKGGATEGGHSSGAHAALLKFAAASNKAGALPDESITDELEGIIRDVAQTGAATVYPWDALRLLLASKVEHVLSDFWKDAPDVQLREGESFQHIAVEPLTRSLLEPRREGAPWTTQRLCELLAEPRSSYKSTRKYVYALQRAVLITTTEEAVAPLPASCGEIVHAHRGAAAVSSSTAASAEVGSEGLPETTGGEPTVSNTAANSVAVGGSGAVTPATALGGSACEAPAETPELGASTDVLAETVGEASGELAGTEGVPANGAVSSPRVGQKRKLPEELSNGVVSE